MTNALEAAQALIEGPDPSRADIEEGLAICNDVLSRELHNPVASYFAGRAYIKLGQHGIAYAFMERARDAVPDKWQAWNDLATCLQREQHFDESYRAYMKAHELAPKEVNPLSNLCAVEIGRGNLAEALIWGRRALDIEPDNEDALYNSALALLALGQWEKGWQRYRISLGNRFRQERFYDNDQTIPRWDGKPVEGHVVVYGEQGIGDEILFASMLPDAIKDANIILECDHRLVGLMRRSFPECIVYGTRWEDQIYWPSGHAIKAKLEAGGLGGFYRQTKGSFPRTPYMVPDPLRRTAMRAMLDKLGPEPKIGVAWNGGKDKFDRDRRSVTLEQLRPLLALPYQFVSLEYGDAANEIAHFEQSSGIHVHDMPWITRSNDYDDTAALVAELDAVVSVTTSVVDLCGAIGQTAHVLVPENTSWRYGAEGEHPFYGTAKLYRQDTVFEWGDQIAEVAQCLSASF